MNNTLHTPGPWIYSGLNIGGEISATIFSGKSGELVGTITTTKANAHLISAAPDLLSALQAFVDSVEEIIGLSDFGNPSESDFPLNQAREALRKARGEA